MEIVWLAGMVRPVSVIEKKTLSDHAVEERSVRSIADDLLVIVILEDDDDDLLRGGWVQCILCQT